jgi:hypothetical protein
VALTPRYPLGQLPWVTSSTPIGWSLLTRLFFFAGEQGARLLPLAFAAGAVAVAYTFARNLDWPDDRVRVGAGVLAGIGVLMVPTMLIRNDLKQYTADACLALVTLAVTWRLERDWSRRGLAILAGTVWGGMLVSHITAFVGVAAFVAIGLVRLARQAWRRALELLVAAVAALGGMGAIYELFDARTVSPALTAYWRLSYLPTSDGFGAGWRFVYRRLKHVGLHAGIGPAWLALVLVLAGLVTLIRVGRPMTACAVVLLLPEMITLSALDKYPLLDARTSTFLYVTLVVVVAVGVMGLCVLLQRWIGMAAWGICVVAVGLFVAGGFHDVRSHTIGDENLRAQARFVSSHRGPDDVIVVNLASNWDFAYYWRHGPIGRTPDKRLAVGYRAAFPTQTEVVVASGRTYARIERGLAKASAMAERGPGARIWLVRSHVSIPENRAWNRAIDNLHLDREPIGPDGLTMLAVG